MHENALGHWALATQKKLVYLRFQFLDCTPCSTDLAPLDYHLFSGLKSLDVSFEAEIIAAAEIWLDGQHYDFFFGVACPG